MYVASALLACRSPYTIPKAGLFSAVITAFIIESYQRLRPDPNDAIVNLLAHIAGRLDGASTNGTVSVLKIATSASFDPLTSDININICWFMSLVLSLTAALIGIITLQWLREHQRYDNKQKPLERMAIFNARQHSLEQWYVPQIFAGLPLLLQGALILFFAGMIEFLVALRLEVAVPVTFTICIPLIFLIATTLLPVLQVCILQDAFRLSINNKIPSPCPYKSPQSLIARQLSMASRTPFKYFGLMFVSAYACIARIVCFLRNIAGAEMPVFTWPHKISLKLRLRDEYPQRIANLLPRTGDWTSIDRAWLDIRTTYAVSLQLSHQDDTDLLRMRKFDFDQLSPEAYDCTRCLHDVRKQVRSNWDNYALYHCAKALCSDVMNGMKVCWPTSFAGHRRIKSQDIDFCEALGRFLCYNDHELLVHDESPVTAAFIEEAQHSPRTSDILQAALMMSWLQGLDGCGSAPAILSMRNELNTRLIINRLEACTQRIFVLENRDTWIPDRVSLAVPSGTKAHIICRCRATSFVYVKRDDADTLSISQKNHK